MNYLWNYDGSVQDWNYISSQFETMEIARGYAVEGRSDLDYPNPVGTTNFTGKFNNGTITQPLYYNAGGIDDDNTLVGNPYPSAISINALLNPIINPDALSVYVWTHESALINEVYENDDYITCSATTCTAAYAGNDINNINGYLASGQGFFVTANALGTLTLNNTMRVTDNNLQFRTPDQEKLWINLSSTEGYFNQVAISFTDNGSENYDEKFDAIRLGNYYGLGFYTIGTNNERFAVDENGILLQNKTIPLGLYLNDSQADNLIISLDHFENLDNVNVTLRDNLLNTLHNLKISDYTFNPNFIGSEINIVNNRFELIFERNALGINDLNNTEHLLITNNNNSIDVSTVNKNIINDFKVYDILGKLIIHTKPNKSSFRVPTSINQGTVLFIKVKLENGTILNTKFIKL